VSKTKRHDKTEPREREFTYIPRGVPILQIGRPYGPDDNRAYVRSLLRTRHPGLLAAYDAAVDGQCGPGCELTK
jgi:hypothetical protein